ncbi:uncharacterized protein F4822DRAFT_413933 [Hypoxylon trugodes]|uniref:uncharacterized protein n=1 Tax=Hypoxylon trugodes TaxID=326681 RepID=UPI00219953CB|nr:uncharacterized protein F4822DRAFT_413933 [Hypoxylon trugodes]KAI1385701.1 hypothetical protein F4822DRAFT_413933 [Hypoxylon trugodes]
MAGLALIGGTFDVCCPGKSVEVDNVAYCCVGNKDDNDNKKRKICIGSSDNCDVEDSKTATCVTAVPATANDFSNRVSQATATMTGQILPTDNAAPAMITAAPWAPWVAVAGGAMANAALFV